MNLAKLRTFALATIVAGTSTAFICGCDREEAKKAGNNTETATGKAGTAIDNGLHTAGADANRGIQSANEAMIKASPHVKAATTQASRDLRNLANEASALIDKADAKIHEKTASPATQP